MEEGDAGDGGLSVPQPTEYRRMLSWQLSHAQTAPVTTKSRKTQKKRERRREKDGGDSVASGDAARVDSVASSEEDEGVDGAGEFAYLVVNSEGEEEWYYSAPESPLDSGEEPWSGRGEGEGEVGLPPQERKRGGRSRKSKKKIRSVVRLAEVEFFGPLCDLVEGSLDVEVGGLEVSSRAELPSLAELCVRSVHREKLVQTAPGSEDNLPFLIHALLGAHRSHRSLAGTHVRWLERFLAAWEAEFSSNKALSRLPTYPLHPSPAPPPTAYCHRSLWQTTINSTDIPYPLEGMHVPIPFPHTTCFSLATLDDRHRKANKLTKHFASILHFANYLYPLFTARGSKAGGGEGREEQASRLSPSQIAAVAHVNQFLTSRYKVLSREHSEGLKLWPGYVYWARGQLRLALTAFTSAVDSLHHALDKAIALNEMGRMLLMFGDRSKATFFFRKSQELDARSKTDNYTPSTEVVQPSIIALEASVWDCGVLTAGAARQAALAWSLVLREAHSLPSAMWYLHLAAVESRMMVHATCSVGSNPGSPLTTTASSLSSQAPAQWLSEVLELVSSLTSSRPLLHYHHSLLLAMDRRPDEARRTFLRFCDDYVFFREWPDGTPGDPFSVVANQRLINPWAPLINLLSDQGLTAAPVLQLQWRTRLLYPMYPYTKTQHVSYLADHCSSAINLHLSDSGYLTADAHMDFPPLRCVFLDPYTGAVCFSRSASLHHYYSGPMGGYLQPDVKCPDETALPWPVRVCEWGGCVVVELVMAGCIDTEMTSNRRHISVATCTTTQAASLHWYCHSQHSKLDLRQAVRRELKKAILNLGERQKMEMEGKEKLLTAMMERGLAVTTMDLQREEPPSKYSRLKPPTQYDHSNPGSGSKAKKKTHTQLPRKVTRNQHDKIGPIADFNLRLVDYVMFGEATLAMFFSLSPTMTDRDKDFGQVLVLINCTSKESFLEPRVHCVGDCNGFQSIHPSSDQAAWYQGRHLPHIRHLVACRCEAVSKKEGNCSMLVLDQNGETVCEQKVSTESLVWRSGHPSVSDNEMKMRFSVGGRIYNWHSDLEEVTSYNLKMKECLHSVPFPSLTLNSVVPIPGCLLVHTPKGLSLLHPGSLQPVVVEGVSPPDGDHTAQGEVEEEEVDSDVATLVQFQAAGAALDILCVYDVAGSEDCDPAPEMKTFTSREKKEEGREESGEGESGEGKGGEGKGGEGESGEGKGGEGKGGEGKGGEGEGGSEGSGESGGEERGDQEEGEKQEGKDKQREDERRRVLGAVDFGSCCVALTLNNRLLILQVPHRGEAVRVLVDVLMPGRVTELYPMEKFGFMLSVTQFPDVFREEVYWLSTSGKLLGMLPCLGAGPRSFTSATLPPCGSRGEGGGEGEGEGEGEGGSGGLYVFFSDGQGGVCCVQPSTG